MARKLTNEYRLALMEKWGFTDEQIKEALKSRGFKDLDEEITLAECAANMGYIWSFTLKRWFDKNPIGLEDDEEGFDALLDEVRDEQERK